MRTKVHVVKAMAFPVVKYGCACWTIKSAEHQRTDGFELCFWRRILTVTQTARRSNLSILKQVNPEYSLERLMPKLRLQYFGYLMQRADTRKDSNAGKDWGQEKGTTEEEMVGWRHWLNEPEFEQTPGDGEGQGNLVCCSPRGSQSDMTEQLNNNHYLFRYN